MATAAEVIDRCEQLMRLVPFSDPQSDVVPRLLASEHPLHASAPVNDPAPAKSSIPALRKSTSVSFNGRSVKYGMLNLPFVYVAAFNSTSWLSGPRF